MSIDVYDVSLGKQFGSFKTEAEALERTRLLLEEFGPQSAADLEIGYDDGRPNLTGQALLRRLQEEAGGAEGRGKAERAARAVASG